MTWTQRPLQYSLPAAIWISGSLAVMLCASAVPAAESWDWQLSEPYDLQSNAKILDIDPDNHSAAEIAALKAAGHTVICYVSVGTVESYRDDIHAFPASVVGKVYEDWPDEKFLDIRRKNILLPIMRARFQRCADLGFDAIEPDNQDVHDNDSGFDVTAEDTLAYLRALADMAHGMGLKIGQKNIPELTDALLGDLDFVITEGCFAAGWCAQVLPYAKAGKPIYAAEYTDTSVDFAAACDWGRDRGLSFILKDRDLTKYLQTCPEGRD